jgi:uncharacterized caspase-like protein
MRLTLASLFLMNLFLAAFGAAMAATPGTGWDKITITQNAAVGGKKKAILIANASYQHVAALPSPPHDIDAVASEFSQLGFQTVILRDPTSADIIRAIADANPKEGHGSLLAFYYSGHAAEIDGENSLVLTTYDPADSNHAEQVLSVQTVLTLLSSMQYGKIFVAFDACRSMINTGASKPGTVVTSPNFSTN